MFESDYFARLVGFGMILFGLTLLGLEFLGHGTLPAKKFELLLMIAATLLTGHEIKRMITIRIGNQNGDARPRRDPARGQRRSRAQRRDDPDQPRAEDDADRQTDRKSSRRDQNE